jgi:hypothetical protein
VNRAADDGAIRRLFERVIDEARRLERLAEAAEAAARGARGDSIE